MVVNGNGKNTESEKTGFEIVHPTSLEEIKKCRNSKILLVLKTETCPACKKFNQWALTYKTNRHIPTYIIQPDNQSQRDVFGILSSMYGIRNVPTFIISNPKLESPNVIVGFRAEDLEKELENF